MRSCGLSDEVRRELREVQEYFRLPSIGLVEKDLYVVKAIAALACSADIPSIRSRERSLSGLMLQAGSCRTRYV
jgi:hypothetical protein